MRLKKVYQVTLTADQARAVLDYDPSTGVLTWKAPTSNRVKVGSIVTCRDTHGYIIVRLNRRLYRAHRLIFLYMTGQFPENDADHVNGDRSDNSWVNLRQATRQENLRNKRPALNTVSGAKGVDRLSDSKWRARICIDRHTVHLGCFSSLDEAKLAYAQAAHKHFGEFARTS